MLMSEFENMLHGVMTEAISNVSDENSKQELPPEIVAERLYDHLADLHKEQSFNVGDLVSQKKGLDVYRYPAKDCPAIVSDTNVKYVDDINGAGPRDCVDIIILTLTDNEVREFAVDSRRFELWVK